MRLPNISILFITTGLLLLICSTCSLIKIQKGSKSIFAFILMSFTLVDGLHWIVFAFFLDYNKYFNEFYLSQYVFAMTLLQSWIFAIWYLESAMKCSLNSPCISPRLPKIILWLGIGIYSSVLTILIIFSIIKHARVSDEQWVNIYRKLYIVSNLTFVIMSVVYAFITVFAIQSILKTVGMIEKNESRL